ncbi:MAG: Fe-S-cluster-containing dehydrogenase component [Natronomonas sp.]|jgi:Fe-S-cluster-containing dehydrogenase component
MSGTEPIEFDDDWETRMERLLEEGDNDTELGLEMAKDAQRVVAGEMTDAKFHEKYHEAVLEEFGQDDRELDLLSADDADGEEGESADLSERLEGLFEDSTRRDVMKKGGAAALGLSMLMGDNDGQASAASTGDDDADEGTRWGMAINLNNCDGCLECVTACKTLHGTSEGAHWLYVMAYEDPDQSNENFFVRTCQHCGSAPCEKVCPVGARHTREKDGLVLSDYDICIGCRYCMVSCPYGANYFQWGEPDQTRDDENFTHDERGKWVDGPPPEGVMSKCTFEPAWQDGAFGDDLVGTTMCEQACRRDAIHFGDMNDPESAPNQHIKEYKEQHQNDLSEFENRNPNTVSTFRALEERGTDPGVVFIGNEPSQDARQVEGPVTYEEKGLVDNRKKEILDDGPAPDEGSEEA